MSQEKYPITKELVELFDKHKGALSLRNKYIKKLFGYKKALRASIDAHRFQREFWAKVRGLYPEFEGKALQYDEDSGMISLYVEKYEE